MDPTDTPQAAPDPAREPPRCRCGHTRGHVMVSPEPKYSFGAWLWLSFGVSAKPEKVRFRCRRCGEVIEESTDPADLEKELGAH